MEVQESQGARPERRAFQRYSVDGPAVVYLVRAGGRVEGRILDLSVSGCRIRTMAPFSCPLYARTETEFRLQGLPVRLPGVVQAFHDRQRREVGLRFLDLSERKRSQIQQLVGEIREACDATVPDLARS